MNHIIVTGGTGFIGSHLVEKLLSQNKKVILLKRSFSNTWRINEFKNNSNLTLIDLDFVKVDEIFNQYNIEGIIHLASFSQRNHDSSIISKMIDSNITFPTILLENAIKNDVKYFINTGSFFEYDFFNVPISEDSLQNPFNLYASTKLAFEDILKFYNDNYDLSTATLKLFTPYGPKDDVNKITPYLIINSIKKNQINIRSSKKQLDFIFIKDVIDAYIKLMININNLEQYESFNIGTGISTSIPDLLSIIENYVGKNNSINYEEFEDDNVYCSNKKALNILDWKPQFSLEDGLKLTIDYYKNKK